MSDLLRELTWRGLLQDHTPTLGERLAEGPITGYVGFDPTAPSLQLGNLVPVMLLAHLQRAGGRPIVLLGGGTGLIGDPSGRDSERPLLDSDTVAANVERQRAQLERFLDFESGSTAAVMLNNVDWLGKLNLVEFLRDIGKHFTVNYMLQKESVRGRMESGISYTEFSYMLLQAYDFLHLYRTHDCELQLGGSDQWGNVTAGVELIRRIEGGSAHGISAPLVTDAAGKKFGKSEGGAIWLAPEMTSAFQFFQFWINADDRDVGPSLRRFSFRSEAEIEGLMEEHTDDPGARIPHRALALEMCERVHGADIAERTRQASEVLFGELDPLRASRDTWALLAREVPSAPIPAGHGSGTPVVDLLSSTGIVKSKGEARRLIEQGGIALNGVRVTDTSSVAPAPLDGNYFYVRRGKKTSFILTPSP